MFFHFNGRGAVVLLLVGWLLGLWQLCVGVAYQLLDFSRLSYYLKKGSRPHGDPQRINNQCRRIGYEGIMYLPTRNGRIPLKTHLRLCVCVAISMSSKNCCFVQIFVPVCLVVLSSVHLTNVQIRINSDNKLEPMKGGVSGSRDKWHKPCCMRKRRAQALRVAVANDCRIDPTRSRRQYPP